MARITRTNLPPDLKIPTEKRPPVAPAQRDIRPASLPPSSRLVSNASGLSASQQRLNKELINAYQMLRSVGLAQPFAGPANLGPVNASMKGWKKRQKKDENEEETEAEQPTVKPASAKRPKGDKASR